MNARAKLQKDQQRTYMQEIERSGGIQQYWHDFGTEIKKLTIYKNSKINK